MPLNGESLSSYMHRLAKANYISNHELWRHITPEGVHYPQTSMSSNIDVCPVNLMNMNKLENMLMYNSRSLDPLTFIPVLQKMDMSREEMPASRSLSGLISKYRKFCPECLKTDNYYKLIWQVNELKFCPKHNIKLESKCQNCNKQIPILPSKSFLGECPYCNNDLRNLQSCHYKATELDFKIFNDWDYLLDNSKSSVEEIENLKAQQNLAVRIIFVSKDIALTKNETTTMKGIYQIARESKSSQTFLNLESILYFSRRTNTPLGELFTVQIPVPFVEDIFKKSALFLDSYFCMAPWCKNYLISGKLKRTSTSTKHLTSGDTQNYYMFCPCCGTEYAIDRNKKLQERGYFISLAWNKVRNNIKKISTLTELAILLNTTEDKIKRSIIFLSANSLADRENILIEIPEKHNPNIAEKIKHQLKNGISSKQIRSNLKLNYNSFLYYWYHPEIRLEYLCHHDLRPYKCKDKSILSNQVELAIKSLIENNIDISVKKVCNVLKICPETLRNWNLLNKIQQAKKEQVASNSYHKKEWYVENAKKYIYDQNIAGIHVYSDKLYLELGNRRNVIVRTMPDVTKNISILLKNQTI